MVTPPEVARILAQLEPVMARWYVDGTLGEVAIVCGNHELQIEERPKRRHEAVKYERGDGRASPLKRMK